MRPPSPGNWSSRYGWRGEGVTRNFHHGLDIGWAAGRTLVAPEDGEIIHYGRITGWRLGLVQIIRGVSGYDHWLAHTDHSLRGLGPVKEGQPVSVMGDTDAPGQVHVHWETRLNGERLNPEDWLARPATGNSTPFPTDPDDEEEADMAMKGAAYTRGSDNARVFLLFNEASGFWQEHTGVPGEYNNALAKNWGTGSWPTITEAHARVIKNSCDKVRAGSLSVSGAINVSGLQATVDIDPGELAKAVNDDAAERMRS